VRLPLPHARICRVEVSCDTSDAGRLVGCGPTDGILGICSGVDVCSTNSSPRRSQSVIDTPLAGARRAADMRASPGRLAGRPCSTRTGNYVARGRADRRSPDIMPAYDPDVCRRRLRDIPQLPRGSWQEGKLKGLIAGCGGQAFEHLSAACPPDPAPCCGCPGVADWSARHRVRVPEVACASRLGWAAITG
jgi:hypothetical protein